MYELKYLLLLILIVIVCSLVQIISVVIKKDIIATWLAFILTILSVGFIGFIASTGISITLVLVLICLELYYLSDILLERDYIFSISNRYYNVKELLFNGVIYK